MEMEWNLGIIYMTGRGVSPASVGERSPSYLGGVGKNISDDAHGWLGGIDECVPHHELFQDVILNGAHQLLRPHAPLQGCPDVHGHDGEDGAVHGHADAHTIQGDALEKDLHVLDCVDGHARHAHVPGDPRMVRVVAPVGGQIKGHTQALLPGCQIPLVKGITLLHRAISRILVNISQICWQTSSSSLPTCLMVQGRFVYMEA